MFDVLFLVPPGQKQLSGYDLIAPVSGVSNAQADLDIGTRNRWALAGLWNMRQGTCAEVGATEGERPRCKKAPREIRCDPRSHVPR